MKKILTNPILNLVVRIFLGSIFIYAAIGKISDPVLFSKEIANYDLFPLFSINFFALILPWIELAAGALLIAGVRQKANAVITGGMLIIFTALVLSAMARNLNINCGCFSHKIVYVGWTKVMENTGLIILALYVFFFPVNRLSLEKWAITDDTANK